MIFKIEDKVVKSWKITTPNLGRQLVIPDVHGCFNTLSSLLNQIALTHEDQLFLLGDYINRGPNNRGVLDLIFELLDSGYKVYPLRGNHEQMALDDNQSRIEQINKGKKLLTFQRNRPRGLVDSKGLMYPEYANFFASLPYYYELDNYYLVHAGFKFLAPSPFEDYNSMLWIKNFIADLILTKGKKIVRGHVSHHLYDIKSSISQGADVINLDAGCYKKGEDGKGVLCCFDITNNKLYSQINIESSVSEAS